MKFKEIIIVHPNKANYPELQAYRDFFEKKYKVHIVASSELTQTNFNEETILWLIMGFYPQKYHAGFIIHDYRSLSVGKLVRVKDVLKKYFNHRPNLRIFLNKYLSQAMNFKDNIPELFLDMGIPKWIASYMDYDINSQFLTYDFIYVGEISKERQSEIMIENFIKRYEDKKSFLLVGQAKDEIKKKYKFFKNIIFTGKVSQEEVFSLIEQSKYCVNFIPNEYPYFFQTSTKFLEYAALKKRIISTETKANKFVAKKYNIKSYFVKGFTFPSETELNAIEPNEKFDHTRILWERRIKESGIEKFLLK